MAHNVGCTGYSDVCGWHAGDFYVDGITWDSIERSGNTVTVKNLRVNGRFYWQGTSVPSCPGCGYCTYGWMQGWKIRVGVWKGSSNTQGTDWIGQTGEIDISGGGDTRWYDNPHVLSNNSGFGNLSITVGASDTSYKLRFGSRFYKTNDPGRNWRDGSDGYYELTITFPAGTKKIKCTATNATFDIKKAGTSVGDDVSSYEATWDYNTKYDISDIKAKSGYYLTSTTSDTSGYLTTDKTINVASATKYITFKVTGTNVLFDVKLNNSVVANDQASYTNSSTKQGWAYSVYDIKRKNANYILDSTNPRSGTTSSSDITIAAGVASAISFASSIDYKSPLKVTSTCTITIDDKSGRTRNWYFVAKLKQGNTVLATLNKTTGTTKTATLTFDRASTANKLLVDTTYTVEWTISDKTDTFGQTFTKSSTFTLPCLGYIVTETGRKKISYFTITYPYDIAQDDPSLAPLAGVTKYSFKRVTAT